MILHCDMDAFYASVEERDRPDLVGKPVIVGGSAEKRGVVSAASYVARKFGVHRPHALGHGPSALSAGHYLPPRIGYYAGYFRQIREIFERFTPLVEPLSLDEAFLDVTGSEQLFGTAVEIAGELKQTIRDEVPAGGFGRRGFQQIPGQDRQRLEEARWPGCRRAGQDSGVPRSVARGAAVGRGQAEQQDFPAARHPHHQPASAMAAGCTQRPLWQQRRALGICAHGRDDRPVVPERDAKSISNETTFEHDIAEMKVLRAWLVDLTEQVGWRLRRHGLRGRTVQIKVRFADFSTITRSCTLAEPTSITHELWREADELLCHRLPFGHLPGAAGHGCQQSGRHWQRKGCCSTATSGVGKVKWTRWPTRSRRDLGPGPSAGAAAWTSKSRGLASVSGYVRPCIKPCLATTVQAGGTFRRTTCANDVQRNRRAGFVGLAQQRRQSPCACGGDSLLRRRSSIRSASTDGAPADPRFR